MATQLFDNIIFGPLKSRRLGSSLGINLLPTENKFCNFDCVYCECGWTNDMKLKTPWVEAYDVTQKLIAKISQVQFQGGKIDTITFAGNGEPTLHPQFEKIISDVVLTRNLMVPEAKVAVLTNGTTIHKPSVFSGLLKADSSIYKLDAGNERLFQEINQPLGNVSLQSIYERLQKLRGRLTIQSMFLRGKHQNKSVDNTTKKALNDWVKKVVALNPKLVMLYSLDRDTPAKNLEKVPPQELQNIARLLAPYNISTLVA